MHKLTKQAESDTRVEIASEMQVFRCRECKGNPEFLNLQYVQTVCNRLHFQNRLRRSCVQPCVCKKIKGQH